MTPRTRAQLPVAGCVGGQTHAAFALLLLLRHRGPSSCSCLWSPWWPWPTTRSATRCTAGSAATRTPPCAEARQAYLPPSWLAWSAAGWPATGHQLGRRFGSSWDVVTTVPSSCRPGRCPADAMVALVPVLAQLPPAAVGPWARRHRPPGGRPPGVRARCPAVDLDVLREPARPGGGRQRHHRGPGSERGRRSADRRGPGGRRSGRRPGHRPGRGIRVRRAVPGPGDGPRPAPLAGPGTLDPHSARPGTCCYGSSPSPSRGPPTTPCWPWPRRPSPWASTPSSGATTTWPWATPTACPVPATPGSPWPASPGRPTGSGSAPWSPRPPSGCPGPLAISVAGVDAMSGGRVELGLGAGWYEAEHTAYGIPFPPLGQRFERLEEQLAIVTGLWGTPDGETFTFEGDHYRGGRQPGPAQAGAAAGSADHHRRAAGRDADPPPGRHLRRRVQSGLPVARPTPATSSSGSAPPARRPGGIRHRWSTRPPRWCAAAATRPRSAAGPRPSGARWTSSASTGCAARPTRCWPSWPPTPGWGPTRIYLQILDLVDLEHLALIAEEVLPHCAAL